MAAILYRSQNVSTGLRIYSTGVQIVSCTLSSDSVLSDSTGLFNPVLSVSANEIAFDKKLANQSVSFNWC